MKNYTSNNGVITACANFGKHDAELVTVNGEKVAVFGTNLCTNGLISTCASDLLAQLDIDDAETLTEYLENAFSEYLASIGVRELYVFEEY